MPRRRRKKPAPNLDDPCPELMKITMDAPGGIWNIEDARRHVAACPHCQHIMRGITAEIRATLGGEEPETNN